MIRALFSIKLIHNLYLFLFHWIQNRFSVLLSVGFIKIWYKLMEIRSLKVKKKSTVYLLTPRSNEKKQNLIGAIVLFLSFTFFYFFSIAPTRLSFSFFLLCLIDLLQLFLIFFFNFFLFWSFQTRANSQTTRMCKHKDGRCLWTQVWSSRCWCQQ